MSFTAYQTLAARNYDTQTILRKIELARVEDETIPLYVPSSNTLVSGVKGIHPGNTDIPAFTHPLHDPERGTFYIDTRTMLRLDSDGNQKLQNVGDYRFQLTRAILSRHWVEYSPQDLVNTGDLGALVFMRWLGGSLSRKLGLTAGDQIKVSIVTLFYWFSLFRDSSEQFSEKEKMRIVTRLNQLSSIPSTYTMEVIDTIGPMGNVEALCEQLKTTLDNSRVDMVTPAFLFAMLGGSWFGVNVKESIAVSVEHPPTFLAMISEALINRSYRKTQIGSLVYDNDKRGRGELFNRNMRGILEAHYA